MNSTPPLISMGYSPPSNKSPKKGFKYLRSFSKTLLFIVILVLSLHISHSIPNELLPDGSRDKELAIQEIFEVLERQPTGLDSVTKEELAKVIYEEALRYDQDPKFILALIAIESSFQNWSVSSQGARGLMQIMPYVAESLAQEVGIEWIGDHLLFDPILNIKIGVYYLSKLIQDFSHLTLALEAYNYGPTYIKHRIANKRKIRGTYSRKILVAYQNL